MWRGGARGALSAVSVLVVFGGASAHVSLLWPPARGIGLDFLDSFRTQGDCGENSGKQRTLLKAGASINITWHLGYPHKGGYKLELKSPSKEHPLVTSEWGDQDRSTGQTHLVSLPQGVTCDDCYIKLQRQAREWGEKYIFRSCADVTIQEEDVLDCGEGGTFNTGTCVCNRGWVGERCQYTTDCIDDMDCNQPKGQGKCIVTDTAVYRIGKCFCAPGWQGKQCETQSQWKPEDAKKIVSEDYQEESLGGGVRLLWKPLEGSNMELVLIAPTLSWVALGWRPRETTKGCQVFPEFLAKPKGSDFHAMDCTDMVVGAGRGGFGWAGDYYTRDRSTPRPDSDYGGEDDLISSVVWEEDGMTKLRAIKNRNGGVADHPLQGECHVIWAVGQDSGFYGLDQLKYHGSARGIALIDFGTREAEEVDPLTVGLGVSVSLLLLLLALQVAQNLDKKLSCLNPFTYKAFN